MNDFAILETVSIILSYRDIKSYSWDGFEIGDFRILPGCLVFWATGILAALVFFLAARVFAKREEVFCAASALVCLVSLVFTVPTSSEFHISYLFNYPLVFGLCAGLGMTHSGAIGKIAGWTLSVFFLWALVLLTPNFLYRFFATRL